MRLAFGALLALPVPAAAADPVLVQQVEALIAAAPPGTRIGLLVVDDKGRDIVAHDPDQRFIPASNAKLFTTAAAYALLPGIDQPDSAGGAGVALEGGNVVLYGRGDGRLADGVDCVEDCLATLADAVAKITRRVRDVIGDDTWFPDQRWSPGMSWNNIGTHDGTATSALSLDDNALEMTIAPGVPGQAPRIAIDSYVRFENAALSVEQGSDTLALDHPANTRDWRLYGTLPVTAAPYQARIGIDDPAEFAAYRLAALLRERGVQVVGKVLARHRPVEAMDRNADLAPPAAPDPHWLARLEPPPLAANVVETNKQSNNLHAELLLRRMGRIHGDGSLADGLAAEQQVFDAAGIPRAGYDLADGSGMSTYDRASPRAVVALLRWISAQQWGEAWSASLPIGGVDGTLKHRFLATPLAGNIHAKTGTLNATSAISGYLVAASGQRLTFSVFANDIPGGESANVTLDSLLLAVAAAS